MDQLRSDPPLSEDLPLLEGQPLSGERPLPDQQNAAACKIQVLILLILPKPETQNPETLSHTMDSLLSFRKSTPSQNRQLDILISDSKQYVDDFVGGLTFQNSSINTFCEMSFDASIVRQG